MLLGKHTEIHAIGLKSNPVFCLEKSLEEARFSNTIKKHARAIRIFSYCVPIAYLT